MDTIKFPTTGDWEIAQSMVLSPSEMHTDSEIHIWLGETIRQDLCLIPGWIWFDTDWGYEYLKWYDLITRGRTPCVQSSRSKRTSRR